ncbi:MAG: pilus assembly PilX N-terminal domain-containing protein [Proteobacteria bacterium]|nr:pilus assembly PilX N-terminal domain-containing protein [Pseudomonadota bacterium]
MRPEGGFALAAAMMVLALLSVLGIAAVQSTTLEVQISAHDRDARAALYVAESALEEARYYAARGWGKIAPGSIHEAHVTTPTAGSADFWDGNRYAGFTLVDAAGAAFSIQSHTDGPNAVVTVATGDPAPGRIVVFREIPDTSDPTVTWDAATSELRVEDPVWAAGTEADRWNEWVLWNAAGDGIPVVGSGKTAFPDAVWLQLAAAPGAGPFRLALNPWVAALAAGQTPPGDGDTATALWDRSFVDGAGDPAGAAEVRAQSLGPGRYRLVSSGTLLHGRSAVSLTVTRAGLPEQRLGDWKVEDEI